MARRRRQHEDQENLERWLVSYADFITLLFAFFVVMYAVSSVNEGKYRVLSTAGWGMLWTGRQGSAPPLLRGTDHPPALVRMGKRRSLYVVTAVEVEGEPHEGQVRLRLRPKKKAPA